MRFNRVPIQYDRTPINTVSESNYKKCPLCFCMKDCYGKEYNESHEYECIYATENSDWKSIENNIWAAQERSSLLRLVVDSDVPNEVIWAYSYHAMNILQINVDMLRYKELLPSIQHIMSMADNCGGYILLHLYPIIPTVIKVDSVLEIIDNFRNSCHFHISLDFVEIFNCMEFDSGYVAYNKIPIPSEYLNKLEDGIFVCCDDFKRAYINKIRLYTEQRKLSVGVCKIGDDCSGIIRRNKKDDGK